MNQVDKEKWRRLVPILIVGALLVGGYEVLTNSHREPDAPPGPPRPVLSAPQPPTTGGDSPAAKLAGVDQRLLDEAAAGLDAKMHEVAAWCDAHPGADGPSPLWHCDPLMIVTFVQDATAMVRRAPGAENRTLRHRTP
jgi:hypothetical protein